MGHADIKTTMVYAPGANEADLVNGVFGLAAEENESAQPMRAANSESPRK